MRLPDLQYRSLHLSSSFHHAVAAAAEHGTRAVSAASRTIVARTPSSSDTSPGSTCEPGNDSAICQKPALQPATETLPIVLGAVIPISCAILVLIFLHRRHLKKQRIEDANDPHKSLDFGLGGVTSHGANKKGGIPEMKITDLGLYDPTQPGNKMRGFSMDMGSPYLLPAGLNGSHESIRSMSRSMTQDEYDPYRPVGFIRGSMDSNRPRFAGDNGSVYSTSTLQASDKANLVVNASRFSQTYPKRGDSAAPSPTDAKVPTLSETLSAREHPHPLAEGHVPEESQLPPPRTASLATPEHLREDSEAATGEVLPPVPDSQHEDRKSLPPPPPEPEEKESTRSLRVRSFSQPRPPRKDSAPAPQQVSSRESSNYGDDVPSFPPIPIVNEPEPELEGDHYDIDPSMIDSGRFSIDDPNYLHHDIVSDYASNNRLSVAGVRPLPPQSLLQEDNPEQRANRIRSFYKEYFDDGGKNRTTTYFDDGLPGDGFDGAIYDPDTGAFYMPNKPFAQNPGRRAMTPPPRGAGAGRVSGPQAGDDVHRRQFSTMSAGRGPFRGRPPPQKKLPPPKALAGLPTPAKLGYDSALFNPIDFAPPTSFRELQNGRRPDSPMGQQRPYSPAVRPFTPLASAYDDLAAMPSPHLLRKSGTFTALDFAPPKLSIRDGGASDAGSIRSARSGISAMQLDAVRAGAYRVSRIPKEMVTTRQDFSSQLRPKLSMVNPA